MNTSEAGVVNENLGLSAAYQRMEFEEHSEPAPRGKSSYIHLTGDPALRADAKQHLPLHNRLRQHQVREETDNLYAKIIDGEWGPEAKFQDQPAVGFRKVDILSTKELDMTYVMPFNLSGPKPEDVKQGVIEDCYLFAALAHVAQVQPELLVERMPVQGTNQTVIEFFRDGNRQLPVSVEVEHSFLHSTDALRGVGDIGAQPASYFDHSLRFDWVVRDDGKRELIKKRANIVEHYIWPLLYEKAYAKYVQQFQSANFLHPHRNGYDIMDGGFSSRPLELLGIQSTDSDIANISLEATQPSVFDVGALFRDDPLPQMLAENRISVVYSLGGHRSTARACEKLLITGHSSVELAELTKLISENRNLNLKKDEVLELYAKVKEKTARQVLRPHIEALKSGVDDHAFAILSTQMVREGDRYSSELSVVELYNPHGEKLVQTLGEFLLAWDVCTVSPRGTKRQ